MNFIVTDSLNRSPADHTQFGINVPSDSRLPDGGGYVLPGLYNVYNALAAAALAGLLGASLDEIASGLERFSAAFGRFERIAVGDRRVLMLLIKNPAGANEAVRTVGSAPAVKLKLYIPVP